MQLRVAGVAGVAHVGHAVDRGHGGNHLVRYLIQRRHVRAGDLNIDARVAATAEPAATAKWTRHVGIDLYARNPATEPAHLGDHLEYAAVTLCLRHYLDVQAGAAAAAAEATTATARDGREDVLDFGHLLERRFHLLGGRVRSR